MDSKARSRMLLVGMFLIGLLVGAALLAPGRAGATADRLVYVAVDTDGDGRNDYEFTITEVTSQFETEEGAMGLWVRGVVQDLTPLP